MGQTTPPARAPIVGLRVLAETTDGRAIIGTIERAATAAIFLRAEPREKLVILPRSILARVVEAPAR